MRLATLAIGASLLLTSCGAPQPVTTRLPGPIDPAQLEWFKKSGTGRISGQAFLRQRGGGTVKAAGETVLLYPKDIYFSSRVISYNIEELAAGLGRRYFIDGVDPRESEFVRTTKADADGRFTFPNLPDGDYIIATRVVWYVAGRRQGGWLQGFATISNGSSESVIIDREFSG